MSGFLLTKYFEENRHKREDIQAEIQRKLNKLEEISIALTELRKVKDDVLIDCGTNFIDKRDIEHKRFAARINVVKAFRNADFYFGDDVLKAADSFTKWETALKDYCSNDLPNDLEWRERHKKIETLIRGYFPEETFTYKSVN